MKCKMCKGEFHYCQSCNNDDWRPEGYCSESCMDKGFENYPIVYSFFASLSEQQALMLEKICDKYPLWRKFEQLSDNATAIKQMREGKYADI